MLLNFEIFEKLKNNIEITVIIKDIIIKKSKKNNKDSIKSIFKGDHEFYDICVDGEVDDLKIKDKEIGYIEYVQSGNNIEIISAFVDNLFRGKSIGENSVENLKNEIKNLENIIMLVTNESRKFWVEKCGAKKLSEENFDKFCDNGVKYDEDYYIIKVD